MREPTPPLPVGAAFCQSAAQPARVTADRE